MRRRVLLTAALAALLALPACGGPSADERAIADVIKTALTSTDLRACSAPYTVAFRVRGSLGLRGLAREYERFCAANIEQLAARSVQVSEIAVAGERATARFDASGGAYAVKAAAVELRRVEGRWLIDRLASIALDRAAFERQQARVATLDGGLSRESGDCLVRRLARIGDEELEAAIVDGDPAVLADPVLVCAVRPDLRKAGLSVGATRCVILRLRRGDEAQLVRLLLSRTAASERSLKRRFRQAGRSCA